MFRLIKRKLKNKAKSYDFFDAILGSGFLPNLLIKLGVKYLIRKRLKRSYSVDPEIRQERLKEFISTLEEQPIAVNTKEVNSQHYELPARFFEIVLGRHLKYSCSYFKSRKDSLDDAESNMLDLYVQRAQINDGDRILELGCGWGSLTLHLARNFPRCEIIALSNSRVQKDFIRQKMKTENINSVEIITKDINDFNIDKKFDKIIAIEMFEHIRNYKKLFKKIYSFLNKDGLLFVHIFAHKEIAYPFEVKERSDWISKYFFTGGTMPSSYLFSYFMHPFKIKDHWMVNGKQYYYTSYKWLENMEKHRSEIIDLFKMIYPQEHKLWYQYWRIFFIAVAELFGYDNGDQWLINHYLFEKV